MPRPINHYGWSKYYGELEAQELCDTAYIARVSWLYGHQRRNFVQMVLETVKNGQPMKVITDQIGSPTWTGSVCHLLERVMTSGVFGVYHVADRGAITREQQAKAICQAAGLSSASLLSVHSSEFGALARRPVFTALRAGGPQGELPAPDWEVFFA